MKRKVMVTGGSGFIGSHLVESLQADGHMVTALVPPGADRTHLTDAQPEVVEADIRDRERLEQVFAGQEEVYHLAAYARYDANVADAEYYDVNVQGTRNVLDAARACGVRRVLFTATIEAVGTSKDGKPLTESSPQHPRNIYGRTKLEAELLVRRFVEETGVDAVVVRPPMIYGPRDDILLTRLFRVIRKGVYPLIGNGRALTEFCYVKNQVQGLKLAMENGVPGEVYFVSDERSYAIEEIVHAIAKAMNVRVWTPHLPVPVAWCIGLGFEGLSRILKFYPFTIPQTGRPPFSRKTVEWTSQSKLYVDITKAKTQLGYAPAYSLEDGVRETVAWYRARGLLR